PPLVPRLTSAPCVLARSADGPRLGLLGRARHGHRHGPRAAAAREARGRPRRPSLRANGLGRRLPVRPVIGLALVVGAVSLAIRSGCGPLAAVLTSGWVMFHMGADRKILAVAAGSATAAVIAAPGLARAITRSIRRVSNASAELAQGDLSARAPTGGAGEIA